MTTLKSEFWRQCVVAMLINQHYRNVDTIISVADKLDAEANKKEGADLL